MSQEWDFPPRRLHWREEDIVRPSARGRFERVIDHQPKPKTLWPWYRKQMSGQGSALYKLLITMLFGTFWLFFAGVVASATLIVCLTIKG